MLFPALSSVRTVAILAESGWRGEIEPPREGWPHSNKDIFGFLNHQTRRLPSALPSIARCVSLPLWSSPPTRSKFHFFSGCPLMDLYLRRVQHTSSCQNLFIIFLKLIASVSWIYLTNKCQMVYATFLPSLTGVLTYSTVPASPPPFPVQHRPRCLQVSAIMLETQSTVSNPSFLVVDTSNLATHSRPRPLPAQTHLPTSTTLHRHQANLDIVSALFFFEDVDEDLPTTSP